MLLSLLSVFLVEKAQSMNYLSNVFGAKKEEPKSWLSGIWGAKQPEPTLAQNIYEGAKGYLSNEGASNILSGDAGRITGSVTNYLGQKVLGLDSGTASAAAQLASGVGSGLVSLAGSAANYAKGWIYGDSNTQAPAPVQQQQQVVAGQKPAYTSFNTNTQAPVQQPDPALAFMMQNNMSPDLVAQIMKAQSQQYSQPQLTQPQIQTQQQAISTAQQKAAQQVQTQSQQKQPFTPIYKRM